MRWSQSGAVAGVAGVSALLGACQVLSGLSDLEAGQPGESQSSAASGSAGSSASTGGGQGGGGGGAGGSGSTSGAGGGGPPTPGCELPVAECPVILIDNTNVPVDVIAVDSKRIYWGFRGDPEQAGSQSGIWKANLDGSDVSKIADVARPFGMVADGADNYLFWTETSGGIEGTLSYALTEGSDSSTAVLYKGNGPVKALAIGMETNDLFFTTPNSQIIRAESNLQPNIFEFESNLGGDPAVLALDKDSVYWHDATGTRRRSAFDSQIYGTYPGSFGIALSGALIYGTVKAEGGMVWAFDTSLSTIQTVALSNYPTHIFADSTFVYWGYDSDSYCLNGGGGVLRQTIASTLFPPTNLASSQLCPSNFVRSGGYIYWGDASKKIFRMPAAL